jgi:hypothetical protein
MFFEGGIPKAVAIVSPLNDGSRTTSAPCTPLSVNEHTMYWKHQSCVRCIVRVLKD